MTKLNLKNYNGNEFSIFLDDFMKERNLNQVQMGEILSCTSSFINQMLSGRKPPSKKILEKFAEAFNDFSSETLVFTFGKKAREIAEQKNAKAKEIPVTPTLNKENIQDKSTIETNDEMVATPNNNSLELNIAPHPVYHNEDLSPKDLNLAEQLKQHPDFYALLLNLFTLDDELEAEIIEQFEKVYNMALEKKIHKYTHKEFKQFFLDTNDHWINMMKLKSYVNNQTQQFDEFKVEGSLQLSNSSLFFVLQANEKFLSITTQYQDRHFLNDFVDLVSGVKMSVGGRGGLGIVYDNVSIYSIFIFNPVNLASEIKSLLEKYDVNLNHIKFEDEFIHSYIMSK